MAQRLRVESRSAAKARDISSRTRPRTSLPRLWLPLPAHNEILSSRKRGARRGVPFVFPNPKRGVPHVSPILGDVGFTMPGVITFSRPDESPTTPNSCNTASLSVQDRLQIHARDAR